LIKTRIFHFYQRAVGAVCIFWVFLGRFNKKFWFWKTLLQFASTEE